ncbi:hypothetical protein [Paraburkholderia heleia]|uniref:hypothetical protein n=1 Tax=Paraburkholderia heleia TaxID=634127 RepID=UPI001FDFA866|nr:hypothetical protein [Paraburkholderia heleia]
MGGGGLSSPAPRAPRTRSTTRKPTRSGDDGDDSAELGALVGTLIDKIAALSKPIIPIEVAMWDVAMIASYLHRSESVVRERVVCTPSFPAAIRLPNAAGQKMQPLWCAQEVIDWTMSHKDRKPH